MNHYNTVAQLLAAAEQAAFTLPQMIAAAQCELTGETEQSLRESLQKRYQVMQASAERALHEPQQMVCGLISGQSQAQEQYAKKNGGLAGKFLNHVMAMALSGSEVNAAMGRICAAPTAGSCGILPAVLTGLQQARQYSDEQMYDALLVAGGIGAIITKNATVAGAAGGCQAECGTAAAMAAAAAAQLAGGSKEMCANAAGIALVNVMGLVCDPVAGLVQLPCSFRNASGAINALISADLALAGQTPGIPVDEVIDAMYRTGKKLPMELRETALGGMAAQPAAKKIAAKLEKMQNL